MLLNQNPGLQAAARGFHAQKDLGAGDGLGGGGGDQGQG